MSHFVLTWLATILFGVLIVWGVNFPIQRRTPVVGFFVILFMLFALFVQTFYFQETGGGIEKKIPPSDLMARKGSSLKEAVTFLAMQPGALRGASPGEFYKVITSSLTHHGWLPLALNLWFIAVFGHALEAAIGSIRFAFVVLAGLTLPALIDGFLPPLISTVEFTGGASGVVYAILGALLIRMPHSRAQVALNTSGEFWIGLLLILLPVTYITQQVDFALTQLVLIIGLVIVFHVVQPECDSFSIPIGGAVLYKLAFDIALLWPLTSGIIDNSPWRILVGTLVGASLALVLCGTRGFFEKYGAAPAKSAATIKPKRSRSSKRVQRTNEHDEESARNYLGQLVFIADAPGALDFYTSVVMQKYPNIVLPPQEQLSLARMLHSKGRRAEALHAYEGYLRNYTVDDDRWTIWLITAELLKKVDPSRTNDIRHYLTKFMQNTAILMRDRLEAERHLSELPPEEEPAPAKSGKTERQSVSTPYTIAPRPPTAAGEKKQSTSSTEPSLMPRLKPLSFNMVDGMPGEIQRRKTEKAKATEPANPIVTYWKRHPVSPRTEMPNDSIIPIKVKHTWESATGSSGTYGTDAPVPGKRARTGGRMAQIEAVRRDSYAALESIQRQPQPVSSGDADKSKVPRNYGGATENLDGSRPKIRLAREKKSKDKNGAGGGT